MDAPSSATYGVNSGIGYGPSVGYGWSRGLQGKDAAFLSGEFQARDHRDLTADIYGNSKFDAIQTMENKFQSTVFHKDTNVQLERLQRETNDQLNILRLELLGEIRNGKSEVAALFAERERRDAEKEIALLRAEIAVLKMPAPVVP